MLCFLLIVVFCAELSASEPDADGLQRAAEHLRLSLNQSVDPCDDFFEFSCGKWLSNNPIPPDRSYYDRYTKLSERVNKQIRDLYDDTTPSNSTALNKLKIFYRSCMNTTNLNEKKTDELLNDLKKIGYWPMVHGDLWNEESFDLTEALVSMAQIRALDVFFAAYGNVDLRNVTRQLIHFDRGSLGMSVPQFYLDPERFDTQLQAYTHYMRNIVRLVVRDLRSNRTEAQIENDVKEVIQFETRFAEITMESLAANFTSNNYSTMLHSSRLSDMSRFLPSIRWRYYFSKIMPSPVKDYLNRDPEVIIANPGFFIRLNSLLESTERRVLANIMLWRFTDAWWLQLDDRFSSVRHAKNMIGLIGVPDFIYNDTALDEHYKNLEMNASDSYATLVRKHSVWRQNTASLNLLKPVDRSLFPMSSTTINAAYTFVRNALTVPGAILQSPFFDSHFPMKGSQFDRIGNQRNWWSDRSRKRFTEKTKCIVDQYSSFEVEGMGLRVDGFGTQGENMADNGGIRQSFRAYRRFASALSEPAIPGFEHLSGDQLFFISFATSYCGHSKPEEMLRQLFSDSHSPPRYRINGVVANQPEFARAFNCSPKAILNPSNRCLIW